MFCAVIIISVCMSEILVSFVQKLLTVHFHNLLRYARNLILYGNNYPVHTHLLVLYNIGIQL